MSNETRTITLSEHTWLRLETLALGLDEPDIAALLERIGSGEVTVRIAPAADGKPEVWTLIRQR